MELMDSPPFYLLHGRQPRMHYDLDLQDLEALEDSLALSDNIDSSSKATTDDDLQAKEDVELENRLLEILALNDNILPHAIDRLVLRNELMKKRYDAIHKAKSRTYRLHDKIFVKNFALTELSNEMIPSWIGPYTITRLLGRDVYLVSDGSQEIPVPIHANDLKLYKVRPRSNIQYKNSLVSTGESSTVDDGKAIQEQHDVHGKKRKQM